MYHSVALGTEYYKENKRARGFIMLQTCHLSFSIELGADYLLCRQCCSMS